MPTELYDIQPSDIAIYQKHEYLVVGTNGSGLFDPALHGTTSVLDYSGWRQYRCTYKIFEGKLLLSKVIIELEKDIATVDQEEEPKLFGKIPNRSIIYSYSREYTFYSNGRQLSTKRTKVSIESWDFATNPLTEPVPFTGSLLLGDDFVGEKMIRNSVILDNGEIGLIMYEGPYPASRYQTVLELTFEEGRLVKGSDRSADVEEFRRITADCSVKPQDLTKWQEDIKPWIEPYMNLEWLDG